MKKKTLNSEEKLLLNKISGYSAIAAAALLLTPSTAKGDIVYVDPADITLNESNTNYSIDLDSDGNMDFGFEFRKSSTTSTQTTTSTRQSYFGPSSSITFFSTTWTYYHSTFSSIYMRYVGQNEHIDASIEGDSFIAKHSNGYNINNTLSWNAENRPMASITNYYASYRTNYNGTWKTEGTSTKYGPWANDAENKYIIVKFKISDSWHFGWIRATVTLESGNSSLVIHDWAYEDEAETSITTGQAESPVPIELSKISAQVTPRGVLLDWSTASETENSGFIVQKRILGRNWESLADYHSFPILEGHGTTSEPHRYSWIDKNILPGTSYQYRIGDVDHENIIVWHEALDISISDEFTLMPEYFGLQNCYPNPFNPTLNIKYGLTEDLHTRVQILDIKGKIITTLENRLKKAGNYELQWNAENATSGIYFVRILAGEKKDLKKVLLTK